MKVDLHIHASERSGCANSTEEEQVQAAIKAGLDGMAFTDHGTLVPAARLQELREKYTPFRIFTGIELTTDHEDILVIGLHDRALESGTWSYPDLHAFVTKAGGYLIWAHPFRFNPMPLADVEHFHPDAMEVRSWNTPPQVEDRIWETAEALGIPVLCNTDAHSSDKIGFYYNILQQPVTTDAELVSLLKARRFLCYRMPNERQLLAGHV